MKYQLNVHLKNFNLKHAGTKAVNDCELLLTDKGYKKISLTFNKSPYIIWLSLVKLLLKLCVIPFRIKRGSLVFSQYPMIGINHFLRFFNRLLKIKGCFTACIVHDINALRYRESNKKVTREIRRLNAYDRIIVHNPNMEKWLAQRGVTCEMYPIQLFDYLHKTSKSFNRSETFSKGRATVIFAGNLTRGKFVYDLDQVYPIYFKLFGPADDEARLMKQTNVRWMGVFEPDVLISQMDGEFGLIWDGDCIASCEGEYGDYIQYNNPHKLSLYLASGLPVIIPRKAALSGFVESNQIGFTVDSLLEIPEKISEIDTIAYKKMLHNIAAIRLKLKHGDYFLTALNWLERAPERETSLKTKANETVYL